MQLKTIMQISNPKNLHEAGHTFLNLHALQAKPSSKVHADSDATTAPIKQSIIEMEEKELQDQWKVDCPRRILIPSQKLRPKGGRIYQD